MRIVAQNLTPTPVTVDRKGHQLGGGEFDVVDTDDKVTDAELAAGNLGEVDRPPAGADIDPGAAAAFARLDAEDGEDDGDPDDGLAAAAAAHAAGSAPAAPKKTTAARKATG